MITVTVKLKFNAAKRLLDYDGKCNYLHGYGHMLEASFTSARKKDIAIDFYEIRQALGDWLNDNWDHNVLLNKVDKKIGDAISKITGQKIFYFDSDPSAERMAEYLKEKICPKLFKDAKCTKIRIYDDPENFVDVD